MTGIESKGGKMVAFSLFQDKERDYCIISHKGGKRKSGRPCVVFSAYVVDEGELVVEPISQWTVVSDRALTKRGHREMMEAIVTEYYNVIELRDRTLNYDTEVRSLRGDAIVYGSCRGRHTPLDPVLYPDAE